MVALTIPQNIMHIKVRGYISDCLGIFNPFKSDMLKWIGRTPTCKGILIRYGIHIIFFCVNKTQVLNIIASCLLLNKTLIILYQSRMVVVLLLNCL